MLPNSCVVVSACRPLEVPPRGKVVTLGLAAHARRCGGGCGCSRRHRAYHRIHRPIERLAHKRMAPSIHSAFHTGFKAGVDASHGSTSQPTNDPAWNPVQELAQLWSSLTTEIAHDLEQPPITIETSPAAARHAAVKLLAVSPSREASQEPSPPRRSHGTPARRGIECAQPPSRLEFHLWSPRPAQPARAPRKHVLVRPAAVQAALDQLPAQAALRPGRRSRQLKPNSSAQQSFETQVLRISTPVAARGAERVPSMRCSSTLLPAALFYPNIAASTPTKVIGVTDAWRATPWSEYRQVLRHASLSTTPRAVPVPSAAERALCSDSQRRRASLLFGPESYR